MMIITPGHNPNTLKVVLYTLMALILLVVTGIFIRYRFLSTDNRFHSSLNPNATVSLDQVNHTATKAGIKQWSLKAKTVNYFQDDNRAVFDTLYLTLFSDNQPPTTLTSNTGRMNTQTNDISAFGHVRVVNGPYTLETETLHYQDKTKIFTSPVPVKVKNKHSVITADRMTMDMNTSTAVFEGHVKGVFRESQ